MACMEETSLDVPKLHHVFTVVRRGSKFHVANVLNYSVVKERTLTL